MVVCRGAGVGRRAVWVESTLIDERRDLPFVSTSGSRLFEVLMSDDYETSVRDPKTGMMTVVHSG